MRVWLLTNAPSPYQVEFFAALSRQPGLGLSVRFLRQDFRDTSVDFSNAPFKSLSFKGFGVSGRFDELRFHPKALWECLRKGQDIYVLSGLYTSPTILTCALVLTLLRRKYVLWLERPKFGSRKNLGFWRSSFRQLLEVMRSLVLRGLCGGARRVICIGSLAVKQYHRWAPSSKLKMLPYCCDTDRFRYPNRSQVDWLKSQWNFAGRFVFLYSGQLITRKGVDSLLVAYREVARQRTNTSLLILGDGPELADLEKQAEEIQTGQIVFAGHQPQEILPSYFACANAFVFPSRHDGWGVVINEAAAAGLPLIATYETGAAHDLILEGHNGFCCQADDVGAFADRMLWMIDNRQELSRMGEYSQELAGACSAEVGAAQFSEMLREVVR